MKKLRRITFLAIGTGILLAASSCAAFVSQRHDQGLHRGWFKQTNTTNHSVRSGQGTKGDVRKSSVTKPPGKANQGKHKGHLKNNRRK